MHMRDDLESRIRRAWERPRGAFGFDPIAARCDRFERRDPRRWTSFVAVEQRNVTLEEEAAADLQLAQLGMAVEIINHEFNATVRSLRNNLRRLKAWADVNTELETLYQNIRASFDHLDGYLTLFTPLHRRLYRKAVSISGSEIFDFLQDLFGERLTRHDVTLIGTRAFFEVQITGFPSSFYPVFVNLVDNAIFWLSQQNQAAGRWIELDAKGGILQIRDSGAGVHRRDAEAVFEYGFTRKPGGRGMGLAISRDALRKIGYDLTLADGDVGKGAIFRIAPVEQPQGQNGGG